MSDDAQVSDVVEEVAVVEPVEIVETPEAPEIVAEPEAKPEPKDEETEAQRKINRAVRLQFKAEAQAEQLRERLERIEQQRQEASPVVQQVAEVAPTPDQFVGGEYDPEFIKATARFEARQEMQQQLQAHNTRQAQERAQAARQQTAESWNQKVNSVIEDIPDYAEVVGNINLNELPPHVGAMLAESDVGPKIAYHLMTHPEEAIAIGKQSPVQAIRALMRIEEKITATPLKKATDTPAPITPVGAKAKSEKDPSDMTFSEFKEYRRKQIAKRR